jgi:heme-degrading monooxygenase HmoA
MKSMHLPTMNPHAKALAKSVTQTIARALSVAMVAGLLMGFSMAMPYRVVDPGVANGEGEVVVVITEVRLGGDRSARSVFWSHVRHIEKALPGQPGLVGYALRREIFGATAWTMTVWASDGAIGEFMRSAVHRKAVQDGLPAVMVSSFVRFRRPAKAGPPGWTEAIEHLRTSGRSY